MFPSSRSPIGGSDALPVNDSNGRAAPVAGQRPRHGVGSRDEASGLPGLLGAGVAPDQPAARAQSAWRASEPGARPAASPSLHRPDAAGAAGGSFDILQAHPDTDLLGGLDTAGGSWLYESHRAHLGVLLAREGIMHGDMPFGLQGGGWLSGPGLWGDPGALPSYESVVAGNGAGHAVGRAGAVQAGRDHASSGAATPPRANSLAELLMGGQRQRGWTRGSPLHGYNAPPPYDATSARDPAASAAASTRPRGADPAHERR